MTTNKVNIGLLGFGTIGTGTYQVLEMNHKTILANTGLDIQVTKILVKDAAKPREIQGVLLPQSLFTLDPEELFSDPSIDIIVEVLGGVEPASSYLIRAMEKGKHVVTANKAAVAASFDDLLRASKDHQVLFRYEASVGGGIPILNALSTVLQANEFVELLGILNGTTNYMLTQMTDFGMDYSDVLKIAQEKGFAEPDPTADVEGIDVANKLSILISLVFGGRVPPETIPTEGITKISKEDIDRAGRTGHRIKLIASAKREAGNLTYSVKPTMIPESHPLAGVHNEFNALFVKGNAVDQLMFYGRGAGPLPTGSAVMGDVIEIGKAIAKNAAFDLMIPGGQTK